MNWILLVLCLSRFLGKSFGVPKLLLYVGPPKTGSSSMEAFLIKFRDVFTKQNYLVLVEDVTDFAKSLQSPKYMDISKHADTKKIRAVLAKAIEKNQNVILASEYFCHTKLGSKVIQSRLKKLFKGFEVTVVLSYREAMNQFISAYHQSLIVMGRAGNLGFEGFIFHIFHKFVKNTALFTSAYANMFGLENVKIFDYYGFEDYGKDIRYEVSCGILHIGCDHTGIRNSLERKENVADRSKVVNMEILSMMYHHFVRLDCDITSDGKKKDFENRVNNYNWPKPRLITYNSTVLEPYIKMSIDEDLRYRNLYNSSIIYPHKVANAKKAQNARITTLDLSRIFTYPEWVKAINEFYKNNQKIFCR